jgi:protein SCO1/2
MSGTLALNPPLASRGLRRLRGGVCAFITGAGLPVFLAAATAVYEVFLLLVVLAPPGLGAWSEFAEEFKIWCFSYDPRTGGMEWMAVIIMMAEPLFIVGLISLIWRFSVRTEIRPDDLWRHHLRAGLVGLALGGVVASGLYAYGRPVTTEDADLPPFPGERIRTRLTPPDFALTDQFGLPVALSDLRGRVTLVTGVYALCSTTCPDILIRTSELLKGLPAAVRAQLNVVALSLNPEYDTAEQMAALAAAYGLEHPQFRYLNGAPAVMSPLLRDFQFAARRNPETGAIDHANLFVLIDPAGRIAYRLNLDRRHRDWLHDAVLALAAEVPAAQP